MGNFSTVRYAPLTILLAVLWPLSVASATEFSGYVSRIIDGDTFVLASSRTIRLCGIDAPEHGDAGFAEATDALNDIVHGANVICIQVGAGTVCDGRSRPTNQGRVVAQCFVGDNDVADLLIQSGTVCDWVRFSGGHYSRTGLGQPCP